MIPPVIYTKVPASDPALIAQAAEHGLSDLHEALGGHRGRMGLMRRMRPLCPQLRIAGRAITAFNYPGDNLMMHKALQLAQPGDVLVVTNGGGSQGALWGDLAGTYAKTRKLGGVIVEGSIRDTAALAEMNFPVWFTDISVCHPEKSALGAVNVPIVCDGALVNPGDIVVADADGVLVVPRRYLRDAVEGATARKKKEDEVRRALSGGATLFDVFNGEATLKASGIAIKDMTWLEDERLAD
jgi:4-hydroxy-4-methyl-2-oxoglutarate aldolase